MPTIMRLSSEQSDNVSLSEDQLVKRYNVCQYLYGSLAVFTALIPDRTMSTMLATKLGGAAGFGLAAGASHILAGAAEHGRLGSDTYKRLNVGLLVFSLLGIAAIPGEAGFLPSFNVALPISIAMSGVRCFSSIVSYQGWKRGISSENADELTVTDLWKEIVSGMKTTIRGLRVQEKTKAMTYRNILLLVILGIFSSLMEGVYSMRLQRDFAVSAAVAVHARYQALLTRTWFDISLQWSAMSRLFLVSTMIYSLKDAAERDRLTGTTFVQMNFMIGTWATLVALGQAVYPLGFAAYRGVEMFAIAMPFFIKGLKSLKDKQAKKKLT